jgi:hypothetical protein
MSKKLRFRARGTALVQNHERLEAGIKSFIGRKFVQLDAEQWGFDPTGTHEEVAYRAEYVKACQDGDLYPADEATARACGVSFDPHFGTASAKKADKGA